MKRDRAQQGFEQFLGPAPRPSLRWRATSALVLLFTCVSCGVDIKAVRVASNELSQKVLSEPGIYYYLPRTRLQLSLPVEYHKQLIDRSDQQLDKCIAKAAQAKCDDPENHDLLVSCELLETSERYVVQPVSVTTHSVPDFNQLYRVSATAHTPFQGVSHAVTFSGETPGVMMGSSAEASDKTIEILAAVATTLLGWKIFDRAAPKPGPSINWEQTLIPCSDVNLLKETRKALEEIGKDKTVDEALKNLAMLKNEDYWGGKENPKFKAPLEAIEKHKELRQTQVNALRAQIAQIKVRNNIASSTQKLSWQIPLRDKAAPDESYLEPKDHQDYQGFLKPADTAVGAEILATRESLERVARRRFECFFENDPKKCVCEHPLEMSQPYCEITSRIDRLRLRTNITSTAPKPGARGMVAREQEDTSRVGGYRYRVPIPARVEVYLSRDALSDSGQYVPQESNVLTDALVEIAQFGAIARLPHRFSGQKAGVELTLNKAGGPIRLKVGSEPASTEPITKLLESERTRAEQRRKERKEDAEKATEAARKAEYETIKLEADTLEQRIRLDKLRAGQVPE